MHTPIHINYAAIITAVVVSFIFGFLWYGPLFGKQWAALMGIKMEEGKCGKPESWRLAVTIFGTLLTAYVLDCSIQKWMPVVLFPADKPSTYGFYAAFFTWLGFYVPLLLGSVTWENKPWKLFGLNALYNFLNLQLIAAILSNWR